MNNQALSKTSSRNSDLRLLIMTFVYPEICMVLDIDNSLLTPSFGKYGDYSNGQDGTHACLKMEYCLTQYSNKTAKLVQTLTQEQFATSPEELLAIRLLMLTNYELGKD